MNDAVLTACQRLDSAAAALRVYLASITPEAEETTADNVPTRQVALRGITLEIERARAVFLSTRDGNEFDNMPLMFFEHLAVTADQALWVALGENGRGAPSNADLCDLLCMALRFHAEGTAEWPALPVTGGAGAGKAGQRAKGGAA